MHYMCYNLSSMLKADDLDIEADSFLKVGKENCPFFETNPSENKIKSKGKKKSPVRHFYTRGGYNSNNLQ